MTRKRARWTHPSVVALAGVQDPVEVVIERARAMAMEAMDKGWSGPPFDPVALAQLLDIDIVAREDIRDARTVPSPTGTPKIEYNPTRPRGRVRYSLAHEIAHTLFPDWADEVRERANAYELKGDDWQLEALCNIAAAEFVMPIGSFTSLASSDLGIDPLLTGQKTYDVSMEALLIRAVHLRPEPCGIFCATLLERGQNAGRHRIDYFLGSRSWNSPHKLRGLLLPPRTLVAQCSAIGFTAKGTESWIGDETLRVEAVGIPPYPGSRTPRVVGLVMPSGEASQPTSELIEFVFGDATKPHGEGLRMIVHVVTDQAMIWGGGGFAACVRKSWPRAQDEFRRWVSEGRDRLTLGHVHFSSIVDGVQVASIVAQHGYGPSARPRIRYGALRQGLTEVAREANESAAAIHMPRIGTGLAGGSWDVVEELVWDAVCRIGLHVTVYDLTGRRSVGQESLFSLAARSQGTSP